MSDASPPRRHGKAARNERRKAFAATFNALSVAPLVTSFLQPIATERDPNRALVLASILVFVAFQMGVHYILDRLED